MVVAFTSKAVSILRIWDKAAVAVPRSGPVHVGCNHPCA